MTNMSPWVIRNVMNAQSPFPRGSQFAGADEQDASCMTQANSHYDAIYLAAVGAEEWDDDATALACLDEHPS